MRQNDMNTLFGTLAIGAVLALSAPVLANDAHHPAGSGDASPIGRRRCSRLNIWTTAKA